MATLVWRWFLPDIKGVEGPCAERRIRWSGFRRHPLWRQLFCRSALRPQHGAAVALAAALDMERRRAAEALAAAARATDAAAAEHAAALRRVREELEAALASEREALRDDAQAAQRAAAAEAARAGHLGRECAMRAVL
jgi:DNA anti-recombination protein RmuC